MFLKLTLFFSVLIYIFLMFSATMFLKETKQKFFIYIQNFMINQTDNMFSNMKEKLMGLFYLLIFLIIFMNNITGNMSNTYSGMSIIFMSLFFSLTFWSSMKMKGIFHNVSKMFIELTPENSPLFLIWLNVFSHFLSSIVSGMILSLRITANLSSGELILDLISWMLSENMFLFFIQILFTILEMMISFVQAFIFLNLSSLFYKDLI